MNYLAHLFLADKDDDSLIGNLLGDFVNGRPGDQYNPGIVRGIYFHRKIDIYADAHPVTKQSKNLFSRQRRRFAGIVVDVCCDHFLSRHWGRFSTRNRMAFINNAYAVLTRHRDILPDRLQRILGFIIREDWLGNYIHLDRIGLTLDRIADRLSRGEQFKGALVEVEEHYEALERNFLNFFPDLVRHTKALKKYSVLSGRTPSKHSRPEAED